MTTHTSCAHCERVSDSIQWHAATSEWVCETCMFVDRINNAGAKPLDAKRNGHAPTAEMLSTTKENVVAERKRLPFSTLSVWIHTQEADTDWIFDGYVAPGIVTLVSAKPKAGKTTFLFGLFGALLDGAPFVGRSTRKVTGILLLTEESRSTIREKCDRFGLPPDAPIHVLPWREVVGARWTDVVKHARAYCKEHRLEVLVVDVLDKWADYHRGDDLDTGALVQAFKPLAGAAGDGLAVIPVTHGRKAEGSYGDAVKGNNALAGAVDIIIEVERGQGLPDNVRVLKGTSRSESTPDELVISLGESSYAAVGEGASAVGRAVHDGQIDRLVSTVVAMDDYATVEEIAAAVDEPPSTVRRRLREAATRGLLTATGTGKKGSPHRYGPPGSDSFHHPTSLVVESILDPDLDAELERQRRLIEPAGDLCSGHGRSRDEDGICTVCQRPDVTP